MKTTNPYDWQRHDPKVPISRSALPEVVDCLRRGGGAVVLGGRGMGKSVFLQQVKTDLEKTPGVQAILFSSPPSDLTVQNCLRALARALNVPHEDALDPRDLIEQYLSRDEAPLQLVLLYDEFDAYAGTAGDPPGRRFFNGLEAARREIPRIAILAAGSLGVFVFRDVLGSSFLSRASRFRLSSFERSELEDLSAPFASRGEELTEEVLDALHLASGGHPADKGPVLVPEAVFSASLYLALRARGWEVEREAESASGRTDLKLWRKGSDDRGVVEVKIWDRNDYREVHRQIESYWTVGVVAGAVIMLIDIPIVDWPEVYRERCLGYDDIEVEQLREPELPIQGCFRCVSTTADGMPAAIDHYLLRIPRRSS